MGSLLDGLRSFDRYRSPALPPGPRSALSSTWRIAQDPYRWYRRWISRHGDPATIPTLHGPLVLTASPDNVRAVFTAEPDDLAAFSSEAFRPFLGATSVVLADGTAHRRARKLLAPAFHATRVAAHAHRMAATAESVLGALAPGQRVSLRGVMHEISLRIIGEVVLGADSPSDIARIRGACDALVRAFHPWLLFVPALHREFGGLGPFARFSRASRTFDAEVAAAIAARRRTPTDDLLSAMLAARDEHGAGLDDGAISDQVRTLLFAGYETTGLALAWAIHWLDTRPELRERLLTELSALGDPVAAAELPLLAAVCDEVLRLSPIFPESIRTLRRPLSLGHYRLPAGTHVSCPMAVAHVRPETFPEPERFLPERFLERRFGPFEFFPWGGGARRCLGAGFATLELRTVLATVLLRFRLRSSQRGPIRIVRHSATMWPACGLPAIYQGKR